MIRIDPKQGELSPRERFGLDVLLDISRLVRVDDHAMNVVSLLVTDEDLKSGIQDLVKSRGGVKTADGRVTIPRILLHWTTDVAGAAAEQRSSARDRYGRVPSSANPLVEAGLEREPILSTIGAALREEVVRNANGRPVRIACPWPEGKKWAVAFTHDLDGVEWWPLFSGVRLLESLKRKRIDLALQIGSAAIGSIGRDPLSEGARDVLDFCRKVGIRTTWFIISGIPTLQSALIGDVTYKVDGNRARQILRRVSEEGHEIGLHGSFSTFDDHKEFEIQKKRLQEVTNRNVRGIRQHFLKMQPGISQSGMQDAGFVYDSTFGFADRNGFRLGAADVLPGWDEREECETAIQEIPFMWMERALSKYQGNEDPAAWTQDGLRLAESAQRAEGLFVTIWHPHVTSKLGYPGAFAKYQDLVKSLLEGNPFCAPLEVIHAWRTWRRSLRAKGISSDGEVWVEGRGDGYQVHLTDGAGNSAESIKR